jgi:hypothetical protein
MTTPERRNFPRLQISSAVSIDVPEAVELRGQAINASRTGVLVEAQGRLRVRVTISGHQYSGWLARAYRVELGTFSYAIELEDPVEIDDLREGSSIRRVAQEKQ